MGELKQNEIFEFDKLALSPQSATKQLMKQCEEVNQTLKEKQLDNLKRTIYDTITPVQRLELLLSVARDGSKSLEMRILAVVLLRRLFTGDFEELWEKLPEEHKAAAKHQLLTAIREEKEVSLRRKACDAAAELCRNLIDEESNNTWPEILQFLFECVQSTEASLKDSALHIFSSVPGIFGNQQANHLETIKQMLLSCLSEQSEVCFSAAKAACSFLVSNDTDQQLLVYLRDLLPGIIHTITVSVDSQTDDILLKCLIDVAENIPKYLRPQLPSVLELCIKIISNKEMEDSWRQLALELVTTLSETASAMLRKQSKYIPTIIVLVLQLMCDLEDEDDWSTQDEPEDDEADTNPVAAESALDRLACGLGAQTMLPHILSNIPQLLASEDWKCRHAALMAISSCGEGCHKLMATMLNQIVENIVPFTRDPHPRVRYAACNALGQMSTDFQPNLQKKFHQTVLPSLLSVLDDTANPRVQAHAGAALVNFCEDCPKQILSPYLDSIIQKLAEVLNNKFNELINKGNKLVLEQIVTTLASVADSVEDKFIDYYDQFMPCLKVIIENAVQPELKLLRGKTIECVSLIGLAVGKEKFMQDCGDVMSLLLASQTGQELADDDPQVSYLISAWARMCKILGPEFEQYLPMVMPPVLKAANIKPEVAVLDTDEMQSLANDTDWQFVTLGDQQNFGIKTAGLEDKATACQMLVCYARELKEGFSPYTKEVVEIMVPLLKFYFHDDCRIAAAESLPYLLDCAKIQGPEYVQNMWDFIAPSLLKAIESEPEKDIQAEVMSSLAQCIERRGKGALSQAHLQELLNIMINLLNGHFKHQEERQEQRKDEDYDDDVEENLCNADEEDVYILSKISDIIHALFGTMGIDFLPLFDQLLGHFVRLLKSDSPWSDRQWGLCIFDDLLEYAGPAAAKYNEYYVQALVASLSDKQPEVRQAAAYGAGVMAMCGQNAFTETLKGMVPLLVNIVQDTEARNVENVFAAENAISAITKICKYTQGVVDPNEVIPLWLSWLPVSEDTDEAEHVYGYFCDLFESHHAGLFGENGCNLPHLVTVIAQAFCLELSLKTRTCTTN
ncbi:hypothetical protein EB796_019853 [Bugula neritina]|uniref:Importin N-terminal domain-containing protein n=1 Tax=Bugula neritina TaxID=10212 RepID=A0A7J7J8Y8_BUGNE|nr:hypothetical protein EB796_019853 [Bugula neritina]